MGKSLNNIENIDKGEISDTKCNLNYDYNVPCDVLSCLIKSKVKYEISRQPLLTSL